MRWSAPLFILLLNNFIPFSWAKLECDPTKNIKKADPSNPETYLYCNLEGSFSKRKCLSGKVFNVEKGECESINPTDATANDDPFSQPFYQAPDDLCGGGIPLTILSAPVACNPSISSCPDGYVCRMYDRTGTSYCCQGAGETKVDRNLMCSSDQVTYIEPSTGKPKACVLSNTASCPNGFGCNLVSGTVTRCCGKDLGCPFNTAAFLNPSSGSHVECSPSRQTSCQRGFSCVRSAKMNKHICCSSPKGVEDNFVCPSGESPLSSPSPCSASAPCPNGHVCKDGKCCPSAAVCPAGLPFGGGPTVCSETNPCREGHECITNAGVQYCCPSREKVCSLPRNAGVPCTTSRSAVTRYYFDLTTGSCRSFQFSQCGGNANNFGTLEECEGFCVDTQCPHGQAYRVGAVNAICSPTSDSTCPRLHACQSPLFGPSSICCPTEELTCNEMVTAGTPCFGQAVTIQRFYFNPATRKCQPFQFYGCNGNSNNFASMQECNNYCVNTVDNICGGLATLMDPNQQPQRCSASVPCPSGYECNNGKYCCATSDSACSSQMSRGNACSGTVQRVQWYYDSAQRKCRQFTYNGCGGTTNRFSSQKVCQEQCISSGSLGACPRGMSPFIENGDISPKQCTLNVMGTCPLSSSCVRSTTNQPICCQTVTKCPDNRTPYVIPGSSSVVACNIDADNCPNGNVCVESSSVPGFHMCCSTTISQRPPNQKRNRPTDLGSYERPEPETLAALMRSISPCPPSLSSNGQTCTVNAIGDCPANHLCFKDVGFDQGSCCRTLPPKCMVKNFVPVFIQRTQVQVCHVDLGGCPRDSRCMTSSVAKLSICCKKYAPPPKNTDFEITGSGSTSNQNSPVCSNGQRPFYNGNQLQECNFVQNTCPSGHKCEFSSTGRAVCCSDSSVLSCPSGSSVFEYGGRPLACPPGSNKCPMGYSCLPSINGQHHLCCSTGSVPTQPQCARGTAYADPGTSERRYCSPLANNCPLGYQCTESDRPGQFICCTQGDLSDRFSGFCPPRQIPYVSRDGYPPTCHMQLNPCPTTAPYVCIYSPQKQDSFCCAPIDTAVRPSYIPENAAARPPKMNGLPDSQPVFPPGPNFPVESNLPGMTQTFPGGQMGPGVGQVAMPDPIPGVNNDKILPPAVVNTQKKINEYQILGMKIAKENSKLDQESQSQQLLTGPRMGGVNGGVMGGVVTETNSGNSFVSGGSSFSSLGNFGPPDMSHMSGCPLGSRPLVRTDRSIAECADQPCPDGFACVFAERENRFQCCSASSIMLASSKPEEPATATSETMECPHGFFMFEGKCLKILFAGQKGCISDEQCSTREVNSTCDSGYCICPPGKPLVHGGKCVSGCPEGFANIAGRCYDPTTVIFMDSVDERANGTIGGYCMETLVEENRCNVANSYCSEKTITCQCKAGYDLQMDFENKDDKGSCKQLESSKFNQMDAHPASPSIDEELYFIDIDPAKVSEAVNSTSEDDGEDLTKYLLPSTDEMTPVFV